MSYITTYTGKKFHYDNINKDSIHIPDILHALPRINRFTGHSKRRYSVGEHTFLGLVMAEKLGYTPLEKFLWFIHDFTEAYVNDCPSPLKMLLPEFIKIEAEVEKAILDYFGLEPLTDEQFKKVKRIDVTMLVLEMRDLTLHNHKEFIGDYTYVEMLSDDDFNIGLKPMDDEAMTSLLTELFNNLMEELGIKKYKIFAGIKGVEGGHKHVETLRFASPEKAVKYAEYYAYDLYYMNPKRDILEIEKEEDVNETVADIIFITEMVASVLFSVIEVPEGE